MDSGLSNKQYIIIVLIILLCGIAIFGRDYVQSKAETAKENVIITFEEEESPEYLESGAENSTIDVENSTIDVENSNLDDDTYADLDDNSNINQNNTNNNNNNTTNNENSGNVVDTSGRVKKKKKRNYSYVGRLRIPSINLNKGFVESKNGLGNMNACVNYNVCSFSGKANYPNKDDSHLKLGAHNGSGWNAYFNRIEQLKKGDKAYVDYKGKRYKYTLIKSYKDAKGDYAISFRTNGANKQMSLFTCARPTYNRYYVVLSFKLVSEENLR